MNDNTLTITGKKNKRYVKALLTLHDVNLVAISRHVGVTLPFVSQIVSGERQGVKKKGLLVRQLIADAVGKDVNELWPKKEA